jgi:hypothetical protein
MSKRRSQRGKGHLFQKDGFWWLRYNDVELTNGERVRKRKLARIARTTEVPNKGDARKSAQEFLESAVGTDSTAACTISVLDFAEKVSFPHAKQQLSASTYRGYMNVWNRYWKPTLEKSDQKVRTFKTHIAERLMQEIAREHELSRYTYQRIKSVISAVFTHARRQAYLDAPNPLIGVSIPQGSEPNGHICVLGQRGDCDDCDSPRTSEYGGRNGELHRNAERGAPRSAMGGIFLSRRSQLTSHPIC